MAPIKICLFGMDERSLTRMSTIFKMVFKGQCVVCLPEDAALAIVDLDVEVGVWESFLSQHKNLPVIVLSESPSVAEGAIYLSKPAKLDLLWQAILRLSQGAIVSGDIQAEEISEAAAEEMMASAGEPEHVERVLEQAASVETEPEVELQQVAVEIRAESGTVTQIADANSFDPNDYFLGAVLKKLASDSGRECTIHIQCCGDRQIVLIPDEAKVYTDVRDAQLKSLCQSKYDENSEIEINSICGTGTSETKSIWYRAYARLLGKGDLPTVGTDGLSSVPLNHFLWSLAQYTSNGRVPVGTDVSQSMFLQCWPNFTRLPAMENGMRIASLWVGKPLSLDEIAARLGIAKEEVYSFYSSAVVCGLAGNEKRHAEGLIAQSEKQEKPEVEKGLRDAILRLASVTH